MYKVLVDLLELCFELYADPVFEFSDLAILRSLVIIQVIDLFLELEITGLQVSYSSVNLRMHIIRQVLHLVGQLDNSLIALFCVVFKALLGS